MTTRLIPFTCALGIWALAVCQSGARPAPAQAAGQAPTGTPDASLNLETADGLASVGGTWRYSDTRIVSTDFPTPGPDGNPTGSPAKTYDIVPHAGAANFDDSKWVTVDPAALTQRRSTGLVCFNWYRLKITIPEKIGGFVTEGSTVAFQTVVDDYAEVWVDGRLPRDYGQSGGAVIGGWNAPNRLIVAQDVHPGQTIEVAVFGINGPISASPANFIWMRSAKLDFYNPPRAVRSSVNSGSVVRLDPALDEIVPPNARFEKIAEGFKFTEGPVWDRAGYLLFSDLNGNKIYKWTPVGLLDVFRSPSGYSGADIGEYEQPGSNGLTLDRQGRLTLCEHGNRRVSRLDAGGVETVLADRYGGKRLNSPNDLVYRSDGALYFTDPPFGLPGHFTDPRKELPYSGVFCLRDGHLRLVSTDLDAPDGLAFSPDEKYLYVDNWNAKKKIVMRYEVHTDGSLFGGQVFADLKDAPEPDACDGMKVDWKGNVYVYGPGGIWIFSPAGKHLGTLKVAEDPHNFNWGDPDGRTLYIAAMTGVYRIRLTNAGLHP